MINRCINYILIFFTFIFFSKFTLASIEDYEEVFQQHFLENNVPEFMHESFKKCAYYYLLEFNPDIAIPNCEELLELSEKEYGKYDYQVIELYFYIGDMYFKIQNFSKSLEYIQYALPINEELFSENMYNTVLGHHVLLNVYVKKLERDKALLSIDKLLFLIEDDLNQQAFDDVFFGLPLHEIKLNLLMYGLSALTSNYDNKVAEKYLFEAQQIINEYNFELNDYVKTLFYNNYGLHLSNNKKLEESLEQYQKALRFADNFADQMSIEYHPDLHPNLWGNIANLYSNLGEYENSTELLKKAADKIIKAEGNKSVNLFINYHNQGSNFLQEGDLNNAILYFNNALNIAEYYHDFSEKTKLQTLINLAAAYLRAGDVNNANLIDKKLSKLITNDDYEALQIDYKYFKSELLQNNFQHEEAIILIKESLEEAKIIWGENSLKVAENLHRLTMTYYFMGDTENIIKFGEEAIEKYKNSQKDLTMNHAEMHVAVGEAYHLLYINSLIDGTNREDYFQKAKLSFNQSYDYLSQRKDQIFLYVQNLNLGSGLFFLKQNFQRSYSMDKEMINLIIKQTNDNVDNPFDIVSNSTIQNSYKSILQDTLGRTLDVWIHGDGNYYNTYEFRDHAFKIAQLINANKIDDSLKKMSLRALTDSKELNDLFYQKSQNNIKINKLLTKINNLKTGNIANRNIDEEEKLLNSIEEINNDNLNIDSIIQSEHNNYLNITNEKVLELNDLYDSLKNDEALLYFVSDTTATASFLIKNDGIWGYRSDKDIKEISKYISAVRESLDLSNISTYKDLKPFSIISAQNIYKEIISPFKSQLSNVRHLFIVPTDKLHSIPFAALIDDSFNLVDTSYNELPWLINSHSISILPSVSSLKIFRSLNKNNNEKNNLETFVGIGNPIFNNKNQSSEVEISFNKLFSKGSLADIKLINDFPELPETEEELKLMSLNFEKSKRTILTREKANETQIKNMDLSNSDIVVFSTHAVINGEIENDEPGLILSPPTTASEENDGILTMSEILQLKLNADFVILSACNTASGENNYSEPLSGLARAFFFAGAKSMLVSNWAVESQSTFELTTTMFDNLREKDTTRSEALQNSMRALINSEENKYYSHPVFWAPFILIGDR